MTTTPPPNPPGPSPAPFWTFERRVIAVLLVLLVGLGVGMMWERQIREDADRISREDRDELRARSRTVECFIVGVIDPVIASSRARGEPVPERALRELEKLRNPASVRDAATAECEPFLLTGPRGS